MKHRNSHFAVGYWSRIRYGRPTPDQADIDPKALKRLLPFVFLLDTKPEGTFTYRLAGTTLSQRYGGELRGRDYLAFWDADSRRRLTDVLQQSLQTGTPVCLTSIGATEDCRMVEMETVLLPITFGAEIPERFLGVVQVLTDVAPLTGRAISFEKLVTSSLVREGENVQELPPPPPPPSDLGGGRRHPRAPHLRLVVSRAAGDPLRCDVNELLRDLYALVGVLFPKRDS
jgi:hypothetical protein